MKGWFALRKGIVDLRRRLQLSQAANARYLEALAAVGDPGLRKRNPTLLGLPNRPPASPVNCAYCALTD